MMAWLNPVAFGIGPLQVHWYGIMYAVSFIIGYVLLSYLIHKDKLKLTSEQLDSLIFLIFLGIVIGGRLGYVLVYNLPFYLTHPLDILFVWDGGLSFHGGLLAIIIFGYFYCRKHKLSFLQLADYIVVISSLGIVLGRIGNFINAELYGKTTEMPWGVMFPGETIPHHPSQLYEALQNLIFFLAMWPVVISDWYRKQKPGLMLWVFLMYYGIVRFFIEFIRLPDPQIGYIAFGWLTAGQILCIAMVASGAIGLFYHSSKKL